MQAVVLYSSPDHRLIALLQADVLVMPSGSCPLPAARGLLARPAVRQGRVGRWSAALPT